MSNRLDTQPKAVHADGNPKAVVIHASVHGHAQATIVIGVPAVRRSAGKS